MNPGITEEVGSSVRSAVGALSSTPMILAVLIFNIMFMGMITWISHKNQERWDKDSERWKDLVEHAMRCIEQPKLQSGETKPFTLPILPPEGQ